MEKPLPWTFVMLLAVGHDGMDASRSTYPCIGVPVVVVFLQLLAVRCALSLQRVQGMLHTVYHALQPLHRRRELRLAARRVVLLASHLLGFCRQLRLAHLQGAHAADQAVQHIGWGFDGPPMQDAWLRNIGSRS